MLTIACVYKSRAISPVGGLIGGTYDVTWVQKLQRAVARNITVPHRFVCLTDVSILGVETIPLRHNWPGWWSKVELFRPGLFHGPVLYFDLDVMITGNLDPMTGPFEGMVMLGDKLDGIMNSTAMWWDASDPVYLPIYARFATNVSGEVAARQGINALGDQSLIQSTLEGSRTPISVWQQVLPQEWFVPFSYFSGFNPEVLGGLPEQARLVYCLGNPKFDWPGTPAYVAEHWR
jgi:hypothetical protein